MKLYFPGLNALRFFAASFVIMGHVEQLKNAPVGILNRLSGLSVTFFFVLSGFLITSLLLQEKKRTGTVSVREFYIRRVLRIWPLYFAVLAIAVAIAGTRGIGWHLILMPNVALVLGLAIPFASQLWSIGVEEQFYAAWPWLMKWSRRPVALLISIILLFVASRNLAAHLHLRSVHYFLNLTRIDSMAIGGLGGYWIFKHNAWFRTFIDPFIKWTTVVLLALLVVEAVNVPYVDNMIYSALFLLLIINVSLTGRPIILETPFFRRLGDLSYGMYMLHLFAIGIVMWLGAGGLAAHVLAQGLTIGMAFLSYRYFETPFLRMKGRFEVMGKAKEVRREVVLSGGVESNH
jgi:peptidoglycan/LPS O-acetylase OafA/YrhL